MSLPKIKSAVTDSDGIIKFDRENKPGISNLLSIYSGLTNESIKNIESKYEGEGYGKFKGDLSEIVKDFLINFQEKYASFYNSDDLDDILDKGKEKAQKASFKTLKKWKSNGLRSKKIILYNIQKCLENNFRGIFIILLPVSLLIDLSI